MLVKLASNRMFFANSYMSLISNNPHLSSLNYDSSNAKTLTTTYVNNQIIKGVNEKANDSVQILMGSQDGAYESLSSSY